MQTFIKENQKRYQELIKTITSIPAPSHKEEKRAEFLCRYLKELGADEAFVDESKNVIWEYFPQQEQVPEYEGVITNEEVITYGKTIKHENGLKQEMQNGVYVNRAEIPENGVHIYMAHIDTVFPDEAPIEVKEEGGRLAAPGVGDDTANVAALLMAVEFILKEKKRPRMPVVFAFNSCEEGLGNLKGCRALMSRYAGQVSQVISFDSSYPSVCNGAVGSKRFEITVRTTGGHSYGDFGNTSAIAVLSKLIARLYEVDASCAAGKSTYNVGVIEGGTSINTIAQEAKALYEIRSDTEEGLAELSREFASILKENQGEAAAITAEVIGERPSMGPVSKAAMKRLEKRADDLIQKYTGQNAVFKSGSTDCNIPFSLGIPAICYGAYTGGGQHTREEYIDIASLEKGLGIVLETVLDDMVCN